MKLPVFILVFFLMTLSLNAQKFASASKGIFSDVESVYVVSIDSTNETYTFNKAAAEGINEPDVFYLIDANGNEVELDPEDILSIEISRGDETAYIQANTEVEIDDDDDDYKLVDVIENTISTPRLYFERVEIDNKEGSPFKGSNKADYYLLQRVDSNKDNFIKVYVSPNFDDGGTEVAPLGLITDDLARNRKDYVEYEEYYFVKVGDAPAIRIADYNYLDYAPYIFNKSRDFRRKYSIPKDMSKERTKKRKKTARKDVGNKKTKASQLRYDEFPAHVEDFQKSYLIEEAARLKKIADREAAREAARKN